ncbi:MAG: DUF952 domain-containing protein [Solirubrobacteraceae bacterium]
MDDVGFIHLSFAHQVKPVADTVCRGMTDLVLLEVDPQRLDTPVVIESMYPTLYGEIQLQAVTLVRPYQLCLYTTRALKGAKPGRQWAGRVEECRA